MVALFMATEAFRAYICGTLTERWVKEQYIRPIKRRTVDR